MQVSEANDGECAGIEIVRRAAVCCWSRYWRLLVKCLKLTVCRMVMMPNCTDDGIVDTIKAVRTALQDATSALIF
ncbi:MAG: hypothetical protein ACKERG_04685 [Candidatus Hodgkinia cicadicola]